MDLRTLGRAVGDAALRIGRVAIEGALTGARRSAAGTRTARRRSNNGARSSNARRPSRTGRTPGPRGADEAARTGGGRTSYSPSVNGVADPGEVVWAWIPYEEDDTRGKDRPALIIGRQEQWLLALPVTSQDHDRDAAQEARAGRYWMDIGSGGWDPRRRPSEVRLDRVVRLDPGAVRREGAALDRALFEEVVRESRRYR